MKTYSAMTTDNLIDIALDSFEAMMRNPKCPDLWDYETKQQFTAANDELLRRSYERTITVEIENQAVLVFENGEVQVFEFAA